jgi:NAD(P)-dependent dehydrogenase (short-subunit alcohol dehydrogenase family)
MDLPRTPTFGLTGETALVAGSSSGIGLGVAVALAESGAHVVLGARSANRLADAVESIRALGFSAAALSMDVQDVETTERTVASAGSFNILVNSAGLARPTPALETTSRFRCGIRLNVRGAYFLTRAVARGSVQADKPGR